MASENTKALNATRLSSLQYYARQQMASGRYAKVTIDKHGRINRYLKLHPPKEA